MCAAIIEPAKRQADKNRKRPVLSQSWLLQPIRFIDIASRES
jgi:hypothetical protein